MKGVAGWLLLYLACSVPVTLFYAIGLAGRFFEYHWAAIAVIFVVLALPLLLVVLKVPSAPAWNVGTLWLGAGSISLILLVAAFTVEKARLREVAPIIGLIVFASLAWAAIWTLYFLRSNRVANTFTQRYIAR